MLYIGSHVSFKNKDQLVGSVKEALSFGENTFMFYTGAPQNTIRSEIDDKKTKEALKLMQENNMDLNKVVVHAPYIINLCNEKNFEFSCDFLTEEIKRVNKLNIKYLVLHPGSHIGLGSEFGINNIIKGLNIVLERVKDLSDVTILLETMAGKGSEIGKTLEEIKTIIDNIEDKKHIGVCLDTCHLNDAGYDMSNFNNFLQEFDTLIGIDKIKCIHINDSKNIISSHKDRHENIGLGTIGFNNLLEIIYNEKLKEVPKILETPYVDKKYPPYKYEIEMIRKKKFNNNLIEDIKKG